MLISLGCEGFFAALAGTATFDFLAVHWSWLVSLLASALVGLGIFSLAFLTLLWQVPVREAISAFSVRHGDGPTDLVFFLRVPVALAVLAESVGIALVVGGLLPPSLLSGLRWGVLQVLVLIPPLLQVSRAPRRIGTLAARLHLSLRRGERQQVEGKKHE